MFKTSKHICTSTIPTRNNKNLQQPYMFPAILTDCPSDPEKSDILQLPSQTFVENIVVAVEPRKHVGSAPSPLWFFGFSVVKKRHCMTLQQLSTGYNSSDFFHSSQIFSASRVQGSVPQPMRPPCNSAAGLEQTKTRMNQYSDYSDWFPKEFPLWFWATQ